VFFPDRKVDPQEDPMRVPRVLVPLVIAAGAACNSSGGSTSGSPWCPVEGEGHTIPSFAASGIANFFAQF
jgi:hypothetical protein